MLDFVDKNGEHVALLLSLFLFVAGRGLLFLVCYVMLCDAMVCYAMLWYVMLLYVCVMLCYVVCCSMLYYVMRLG